MFCTSAKQAPFGLHLLTQKYTAWLFFLPLLTTVTQSLSIVLRELKAMDRYWTRLHYTVHYYISSYIYIIFIVIKKTCKCVEYGPVVWVWMAWFCTKTILLKNLVLLGNERKWKKKIIPSPLQWPAFPLKKLVCTNKNKRRKVWLLVFSDIMIYVSPYKIYIHIRGSCIVLTIRLGRTGVKGT